METKKDVMRIRSTKIPLLLKDAVQTGDMKWADNGQLYATANGIKGVYGDRTPDAFDQGGGNGSSSTAAPINASINNNQVALL